MRQFLFSILIILLFSVYAYDDIRVWQKVEGDGIIINYINS